MHLQIYDTQILCSTQLYSATVNITPGFVPHLGVCTAVNILPNRTEGVIHNITDRLDDI